ncbi:unnamed protein product [Paramecium pentaurelia]|uniref:Uncharacterized protein n=1 Tax=Paramecium pentaurelia TaxID=43138 RepID=A0A8S1WF32_9CILI|nr:unnamed protein product [Paramecium pentaurelia]
MLTHLPKCASIIQEERSLEYERLMKRLEKSIIENSLYRLGGDIKFLQGFYSVHSFNQVEKEKLSALIIEYCLQKYVYSTKHFFQTNGTPNNIKQFISTFTKKICKNIQIKYEDLQQIYNEINQTTTLDETFDNIDKQIRIGIINFQEFNKLFRHLILPNQFPQMIDNYLQGDNFIWALLRIVKSEPISTYIKSFEILIESKKSPQPTKIFNSNLIAQLIYHRPDLPIDNYLDFILEDIYSHFIVFLLNTQNMMFFALPQFPYRPVNIVQPLVYLIGSLKSRSKVWETIERMFLVISDLIHPNSATSNEFVFSFFYLFVKVFVERVEAQNQQQEKNQEEENVIENNIFTKDQLELLKFDDMIDMDEQEEEEDDEDKNDEDSNNKEKVLNNKELIIDQEGIDKFISIIKPHLKYLIYQYPSFNIQIAVIFKYLSKLRPKEIIPQLMEQIQLALERDDIKPILIIHIIEKIFKQAIQYDQYPQIINYIPFIIRQTTNYILDDGEQIWSFYNTLFLYIPIYDIKDLEAQYPNLNLQEEMNIYGIDFYSITQEISDLSLEAFRKYFSTFEYSNVKYIPSQRCPEIVFSTNNKFYNFVFQSSKSNYKEIVNIVCNYLDDKIIDNLSNNFVLLLQAIILRDPNVLKDILIVIQNQILKTINDHQEFNLSNITTISNYLIIIYEIIQFTGSVNKQYYSQLKCIIDLSLQHEETKIQQAGQNILASLILSQAAIHVKDLQFTNDPTIQLDWLRLKQQGKQEKYLPKWQELNDQEFIKQIMDDYYYPSLKQIREIISQKGESKSLIEYLQNDFLNQYQLQYQLESKQNGQQQLELKIRKCLSLNIDIINAFVNSLYFRMKQYNEYSSETFKKFQDQYCFSVINQMYDEVIRFCIDFVPIYFNNGLALDQKLSNSFINMIQLIIHETSDKVQKLGKWLQLQTKTSDSNKIKFYNRFQSQMFYTYLLNNRIDQIYDSQIMNQQNKELLLISIPFLFDSNQFNHKVNWIWLSSRMELLDDREWLYELFEKLYEQLKTIFKNKWFNQQYIESLNESDKQKLSLFQKHFTKGFANFMKVVTNLNSGLFLDSYQVLDCVYQNLIDKIHRSDFDMDVLNLLQKISKASVELNQTNFTRQNVLIIKNQEVQKYVDSIFEQRNQYWLEQQTKINRSLESLNDNLNQIVEQWLSIPIDTTTSRQLITNACALFFMRTAKLPQINERVILKAFHCCISQEYNIRSLGKLLLYRLIQICIFKHKSFKQIRRNSEDFQNSKINLDQYNVYRFILPEDYNYYKLNDYNNKGQIFLYNSLIYTEINREEVKKELQILKSISSEQWHQFINMMIIDESVLDQQQSQQPRMFYQFIQDQTQIPNLFNDIDNQAQDKFFFNKVMQYPFRFIQLQKKVQFMKYLFTVTDYEIFNHTKNLIDQTNIDQMPFQRIYLSSLLYASHSSWDCKFKQEIIDYCIDKFEQIIIDQSKDEFKTLEYYLNFAFSRCDLRKQEQFLLSILDKVQIETDNKKLRWIYLFYTTIDSKKNKQIKLFDHLLQTNLDFSNLKAIQTFIPLIIVQQNKNPHNIELLQKFGILEQFKNQTQILFETKYFLYENSEIFCKGLNFLVDQFQQLNINGKINIIITLFECWKSMKFYINPYILQKMLPIVEYLLTINEENNLQQLTYGLQIFQNIRIKECTITLIQMTLNLLKVSQNNVRIRQLNFLKILTKEILHINRPEILTNIVQYLLDENKVVMQSCCELITQLIQQMTLQELNCQLEIYLKLATNKETELLGKQVLMAIIMAHPRNIQPWINQVLKVVLEKHNKLQQQQKKFAADYLKLYKTNQLMEIEDIQIQIDLIEKMSELSNPYNYFA